MGTSITRTSFRKDHNRWLATTRRWQLDEKKVARAVENLTKYLKKHKIELKKFLKTAQTERSMINGGSKTTLSKGLRKAHTKRNRICANQAKCHKNLLKLSRTIETTVKGLH